MEYGYEQWDQEQFRRAGALMAEIASRRDAVTSMRKAILALYFMDNPEMVAKPEPTEDT